LVNIIKSECAMAEHVSRTGAAHCLFRASKSAGRNDDWAIVGPFFLSGVDFPSPA
jgi:hypothetical protein